MNSSTQQQRPPLIDAFGRVHTSLRVSVTDRCNIRCFYCMPAGDLQFLPRAQILTFEEITRFVAVAASMGVCRIRLTGGEPLVRAELPTLVASLAAIPGIDELALTTNGMLLAEHAVSLRRAGLHRLNVSLDTLDPAEFERITRRPGLERVLEGIAAAKQAGFAKLRLNAIAIRQQTERDILPLVEFARLQQVELRFIEYMPLDAEAAWERDRVLPGEQIRAVIAEEYGPLTPARRADPSQPAMDYLLPGGGGQIGFIDPVSQPFCGTCNRLRLTAEGQIRNCLFSATEWDARALMRSESPEVNCDANLEELIRNCVTAKKPGHGIDDPEFLRPERAMYQIGG